MSACASGGTGDVASPPSECRSDLAAHDRALSEVADSAALQAGLGLHWPEGVDLVVARVLYDSLGVLEQTDVWARGLSDEAEAEMGRVIGEVMVTDFTPDESVNLFLGDEAGPEVRRVGEFAMCQPRMLNRSVLLTDLRGAASRAGIQGTHLVPVLVFVRADGGVREARVNESSGNMDADLIAVRAMEDARFIPALLEGIPVDTWVQVPVNMRGR
jgi:TonB family protein